eukprot:c16361_g1_i1.p1 GENE.c16361_g1_i1~~c16361_g1_i1.p1  ORF type:complete len:154 (+),score=41.07 c16361_g1_i1:63-524(+)
MSMKKASRVLGFVPIEEETSRAKDSQPLNSEDQEANFCLLLEIPVEIRQIIFRHLSPRNLCRVSLTCHQLHDEVFPTLELIKEDTEIGRRVSSKALRQMGMTWESYYRSKALKVLGIREDDMCRSEIVTSSGLLDNLKYCFRVTNCLSLCTTS